MSKKSVSRPPFNRVRQKVIGSLFKPPCYAYVTVNGNISAGSNTVPALASSAQTFTQLTNDWVTPGYEQLIAKGAIVNSPYSSVKSSREGGTCGTAAGQSVRSDGMLCVWTVTDPYRYYLGNRADATTLSINTNNLIRRVQTKALAGVEKPEMQSLVSLAEWKQTLQLLTGPVGRLSAYFKAAASRYESALQRGAVRNTWASKGKTIKVRRNRRRQIMHQAKSKPAFLASQRVNAYADSVTSAVLGYNLGWKPTMLDLEAILEKIPSLTFEPRTWSRASDTETYTGVKQTTHSIGWGTCAVEHTMTQKVTVRAGVMYNSEFQTPQQHFGVRLRDIPEAMWELIPFSFVLDYVVNVEQYIAACRAVLTARILAYYTSVHTESVTECRVISETPGYYAAYSAPWTIKTSFVGATEKATYEAKVRWPDSFSPQLAYNLKTNAEGRPSQHLQNVLSLLTVGLVSISKKK